MTSPRARWLAARTRNAARHGLVIAGIGAIVMIATLLAFVLLPRQADRALAAAIAALPPTRDTLALLALRTRVDTERAQAEARRTAARIAVAATLSNTGTAADSALTAALLPAIAGDTLLRDLAGHLARARQSPLVESYRTLADAPALQRDPTVRATVLALRDSLETLNQERERAAALTGPDARYATLTARLTGLGEQLVQVADGVLREQIARTTPAIDTVRDPVASAPLMAPALLSDSLLEHAVRTATDSVQRLDSAVALARRTNADIERQKDALRARMQVTVPPLAMLLASLVLGVAAGLSTAMWREIRRPTIGDADELEALTRSRVIVHRGRVARTLASSLVSPRAWTFGRRGNTGDAQVPALTPTADAWSLLHLTLSNIGDTASRVQVLADRPVVAGAVALNLAAVAARESRATVLVDAAQKAGALVPLIPGAVLVRHEASGARDRELENLWDSARALPLGLELSVPLVLPRRTRRNLATEAVTDPLLEPLLRRFDLVVFVTDSIGQPSPAAPDVVLCARLGVTALDWVSRTVATLDAQQRRIRAVVLWADDVPLAGSRASG